jgi:hypothetical protein
MGYFFGPAEGFIDPQFMKEKVVQVVEKALVPVAFGKISPQGP